MSDLARQQRIWDGAQRETTQPIPTSPARQHKPAVQYVSIKNDTAQDRVKYDVMGISAPATLPADDLAKFKKDQILKCVAPLEQHRGLFVVLAEDIKAGKIGNAWAWGVLPVQIDVSKEGHTHADVKPGTNNQLRSDIGGGAQILWKEPGTGVKWAVVRLGRWAQTTFAVSMTRTGGADGTSTTPASWTYTVKELLSGLELATLVNPVASPHLWRRPNLGAMTQATAGLAIYNRQGQLVILWTNETVLQEACP